ncbi:MAG: ATP-binding protein [Pseudomonadota bacterium]
MPDEPGALGLDDLPNGVLVVRDGGTVVDANAAMLELLGCERAALLGQPLSSVLTLPAAVVYHSSLYPQLCGAGRIGEAYLDFRRPDGVEVPALCTASLRSAGARQDIVISATRMTERRRLEDDLLRTRRITEQIPGAVYQYLMRADGSHCIPYASEAVREMFGVSPGEVAHDATPLFTRIHGDDGAAFVRSVHESAALLQPWRHQFRARRAADAPYGWFEGTSTPERVADGATLWHGFIHDITERKAVEDALREKETSDKANRAKSEFLARVSHELRTPLNAILGFAQVLALDDQHVLHPFHRQRVQHIEEAGRDLLHLIDEVLDIARIESGSVRLQPEWITVGMLFGRVIRVVEAAARDSGIDIVLGAGLQTRVHADAARLGQVLTNLLSNAIKYNRAHGSVTLSCAADADRVVISIQDTGQGLTEDQVSHLFEPFNRLGAERSAAPGTGLGLVIVKRLVEAMGGSVVLSSNAGQGSTFRVALPQPSTAAAADRPPADVAHPEPAGAVPPARSCRMLYVEDNPVNALVMQAICELRPALQLHIETTGAAAIAWATSHPIDLLLLDMNLPDHDGISLLQALRVALGPRLPPAIAVSADAMPHDVERARLAGFVHYLTKPLDVRQTLDVVERTARDRAPRTAAG